MTKTLRIEGMACPGCEKRVEKALLSVANVTAAKADRTAGEAVITADGFVLYMDLVEAVERFERYHVLDIR